MPTPPVTDGPPASDPLAPAALLALAARVEGDGRYNVAKLLRAAATARVQRDVVRQPAYEIGREAMQLLLNRFEQADRPTEERVLPVELVVCRSTRRSP
ncbi:MAG: hypothetical protein ABR510_08875 [Trueperaceae bacterium]